MRIILLYLLLNYWYLWRMTKLEHEVENWILKWMLIKHGKRTDETSLNRDVWKKGIPSLDEPIIWSFFFVEEDSMVAATLMTATVNSRRLILAHQWLLHMAIIAEKHYIYNIFFNLNLAAVPQMVCLKISQIYHYSFFFLRVTNIILTRRTCMCTAGMPSRKTGTGASKYACTLQWNPILLRIAIRTIVVRKLF
jgi:hypothetical protein